MGYCTFGLQWIFHKTVCFVSNMSGGSPLQIFGVELIVSISFSPSYYLWPMGHMLHLNYYVR